MNSDLAGQPLPMARSHFTAELAEVPRRTRRDHCLRDLCGLLCDLRGKRAALTPPRAEGWAFMGSRHKAGNDGTKGRGLKMRMFAMGLAATFLAAPALAAPPANLAPRTISGWGWNVMDLEAQKAWYEAKLGMKVVRTYNRDGKVYEYIMGFEGAAPETAILALLASPARKPGPSSAGRLILRVPDS